MLDFSDFHQTYWLDAIALEYKRKGFNVRYQSFVYSAEFLPLLGNTEDSFTVTIDRDADFLWCQSTAAAFSSAGVSQTAPNILVQHIHSSSQRFLENDQVHLMNVYGTGEYPYQWMKPIKLAAKSSMRIRVDSEQAADSFLYLSLIGVKAFLTRRS